MFVAIDYDPKFWTISYGQMFVVIGYPHILTIISGHMFVNIGYDHRAVTTRYKSEQT